MKQMVRILCFTVMLIGIACSGVFAASLRDTPTAQISTAHYTDRNFDLSYPQVQMKDKKAEEKINGQIEAVMATFRSTVRQDMKQGGSIQALVTYDIKMNHTGLLSLTLTEYTYADRAAHGMTYVKGMTFNTMGQLCDYSDVLKFAAVAKAEDVYNAAAVTKKLKLKAAKEGIMLNSDFQGIDKVTQEFYFDDAANLHILFQQYEAAPYAVGVIDLNMQ